MSAEEAVCNVSKMCPSENNQVTDSSKQSFRVKVWDYFEKNNLVNFPRPVFGRIPNFKGADKAASKLLELGEFQCAKTVEVNPDKPLEASRVLVVENDKLLYVPVPKLQEGLLKKISFCLDDKPNNMKQIVTRWGIENFGKSVDFHDQLHLDLFVIGSVAVSKTGHRIGKGRGFADLEYAILKEMKAVDDDTIIVTTVHDSQVFDSLPNEIFCKYDVPVDYILTPTQIIKVEKKLPRPAGIYWDLVSQRRVKLMPILQKLKESHTSEGRNTTLKEVDSEDDFEEKRPILKKQSQNRTKSRLEHIEKTNPEQKARKRQFFRKSQIRVPKENEDPNIKGENEIHLQRPKKTRLFRRNTRRLPFDFSLVVSNIDKDVRVRHLKDALIDRGIKPNNITWRGHKGFCYLHYVKPMKTEEDPVPEEKSVDSVIGILQTMKLNPESENCLSVKVMEPITRIETTDVTAV